MIRLTQLKMKINHTEAMLYGRIGEILHISPDDIFLVSYVRRSVDARKKPDLYYIYTLDVVVAREEKVFQNARRKPDKLVQISLVEEVDYQYPVKREGIQEKVVVVGSGPAGMFCSYFLALAGCPVLLLERGEDVDRRTKTVEDFWAGGPLNPESNVQFGEGGAGTFSDGKLNTLVKDKDGRNRAVLETFVRFGAEEEILYDAKPHVGTDVLREIVRNMREEIISLGGEVRFSAKVTDFHISGGKISGLTVNDEEQIPCEKVVLALGHSARDTFYTLQQKHLPMIPKAFAVGFRVQHPQSLIDQSQYGGSVWELGPAPYKVTHTAQNGRGVYSFCMCPGGYVVNASSEEGRAAVNGMSYSDRASGSANSAIIVSVTPEDFPSKDPMAGVEFQRNLEQKAYVLGKGSIPCETYGAFYASVTGSQAKEPLEEPKVFRDMKPCVKGSFEYTDLTSLLPPGCNEAFVEAMEHFGRQIAGFDHPNALMFGVESRTSSPLRMVRDDNLESEIKGIYPCGEGAGYAGGITSAAMDGIRVAEKILASIH